MHIKRYEAATMQAALEQVREELGPDALILSSRTVRPSRRRFGFMASERVEVQAALERAVDQRSAHAAPPAELRETAAAASVMGRPEAEASVASLLAELRGELAGLRAREEFEEELRSELRGLRQALASVVGRGARVGADPLVESLAHRGLDWMHAESLVRGCREVAGEGHPDPLSALPGVLRDRVESRIAPPRPQDANRLRVLVGAPGVGKTTSLAKLAARNEEGERDVALVSLDDFRIGAAEQLRRYAEFLGAPFCEVSTPADLPTLFSRYRRRSILVDTPGRDRGTDAELTSLQPIRALLGERASIELVIDGTARREVQQAQLTRFAPLAPDRLIVAKVDECDSTLELTNLLLDERCPPVCWLGTGQRVPEDLMPIESERLLRDILGRAA